MEKKIIELIKEQGVLECVVENYENLTKSQLKTIFKEFYYSIIDEMSITEDRVKNAEKDMIKELEIAWDIE